MSQNYKQKELKLKMSSKKAWLKRET